MADKIRVKCDGCGRQFRVSPDLAGKNARCSCGHVFKVPHQPAGEEIARKWYYARKGERYGPVPQSELGRLLAGGEIKPSDYVWTRGMPSWQPAETVEWAHQLQTLNEELPNRSVRDLLGLWVEHHQKYAESVRLSKARDDERGSRIIPDYGAIHTGVDNDKLVRRIAADQEEIKTRVETWLNG